MSESFWKKEIHLGKPKQPKPKTEAIATPKVEEASAARVKSGSFWRKERRMRSRPAALPPLPQHLLDSRRAPRGTVVVPVVPGRSNATERFAQEFNEWVARALETPPNESPAATPEPEPVKFATPPALTELGSAVPAPEFEPRNESNQVPEFQPEPESAPMPATVVPGKVPLLKREIHFRRAKTPKPPKAEKQPKAAKPRKEPKAKKEPAETKPSLLKREVRFGKSKAGPKEHGSDATAPMLAAALEPNPVPELAPKEKVPLLKREISFRKAKAAKAPKQKAAKSSGDDHKITRVVGLRIGSTQLTAAHVRNNGSSEVVQLARTPLEHGVVVAGEVRDPIALAKALKSFFAANKLPRKGIRLGIASNRIGVRVLDVPAVDDRKQFDNAIRFSAQESLPIPVADAVLDHVVLSDEVIEGEAVRRVLLVFAHRELIARYVDVCREAGLRLSGIDLDAFALLRAVGPEPDGDVRRASVAVAIGHERTVFAVSDGEVCDFTRVLEWGSNAIDVAIARALNLSPSEAEPLKLAFDLGAAEPPAGLSPMQFEAARAAVTAEIGHLVRELLSSLRFYQSRPGSLDLRSVVLSGGGAELRGFAEEVQRGLGVPVHVGDPFVRASLAKRVKAPENAGAYSVAVGLGIEV